MKIIEVHTHMSVRFGVRKGEHRHFSTADVKKVKGLQFKLIPQIGVEISNAEDCVIVPFVNIISMKAEKEAPKIVEPTKADKEVLGLSQELNEEDELSENLSDLGLNSESEHVFKD